MRQIALFAPPAAWDSSWRGGTSFPRPGSGDPALAGRRPGGGVLTVAGRLTREEIDDLARANEAAPVLVRVRIATPDRRLAAVLEPGMPPPRVRIAGLRALRRAGVEAGILVDPLVPGVSAHEPDLRDLLAQARAAGASFAEARFRRLGPRRRTDLVRRLRAGYPRVAARLEVWERTSSLAPDEERTRAEAAFHAIRRAAGLAASPCDACGARPDPRDPGQRRFAFAG